MPETLVATTAVPSPHVTPPAVASPRRSRSRGGRAPVRLVLAPLQSIWLLAAILLAWQIVATASPSPFFPPPSVIASQFVTDWLSGNPATLFLSDHFWSTVPLSLSRLLAGWSVAVVVGIAVGIALGSSRILSSMYNPIVRFFLALPNAALLPIAFMIFGVSSSMNVFLIFFGTMWVIAANTADGVSGVDSQWLRSARSLHLSRPTMFFRILLPAASPSIFAGLRVSAGLGLILMVISELYATTAGIGFDIMLYQQTFQYRKMWSAFVVIALIGVGINLLMSAFERRALRWQRRSGMADL